MDPNLGSALHKYLRFQGRRITRFPEPGKTTPLAQPEALRALHVRHDTVDLECSSCKSRYPLF